MPPLLHPCPQTAGPSAAGPRPHGGGSGAHGAGCPPLPNLYPHPRAPAAVGLGEVRGAGGAAKQSPNKLNTNGNCGEKPLTVFIINMIISIVIIANVISLREFV